MPSLFRIRPAIAVLSCAVTLLLAFGCAPPNSYIRLAYPPTAPAAAAPPEGKRLMVVKFADERKAAGPDLVGRLTDRSGKEKGSVRLEKGLTLADSVTKDVAALFQAYGIETSLVEDERAVAAEGRGEAVVLRGRIERFMVEGQSGLVSGTVKGGAQVSLSLIDPATDNVLWKTAFRNEVSKEYQLPLMDKTREAVRDIYNQLMKDIENNAPAAIAKIAEHM